MATRISTEQERKAAATSNNKPVYVSAFATIPAARSTSASGDKGPANKATDSVTRNTSSKSVKPEEKKLLPPKTKPTERSKSSGSSSKSSSSSDSSSSDSENEYHVINSPGDKRKNGRSKRSLASSRTAGSPTAPQQGRITRTQIITVIRRGETTESGGGKNLDAPLLQTVEEDRSQEEKERKEDNKLPTDEEILAELTRARKDSTSPDKTAAQKDTPNQKETASKDVSAKGTDPAQKQDSPASQETTTSPDDPKEPVPEGKDTLETKSEEAPDQEPDKKTSKQKPVTRLRESHESTVNLTIRTGGRRSPYMQPKRNVVGRSTTKHEQTQTEVKDDRKAEKKTDPVRKPDKTEEETPKKEEQDSSKSPRTNSPTNKQENEDRSGSPVASSPTNKAEKEDRSGNPVASSPTNKREKEDRSGSPVASSPINKTEKEDRSKSPGTLSNPPNKPESEDRSGSPGNLSNSPNKSEGEDRSSSPGTNEDAKSGDTNKPTRKVFSIFGSIRKNTKEEVKPTQTVKKEEDEPKPTSKKQDDSSNKTVAKPATDVTRANAKVATVAPNVKETGRNETVRPTVKSRAETMEVPGATVCLVDESEDMVEIFVTSTEERAAKTASSAPNADNLKTHASPPTSPRKWKKDREFGKPEERESLVNNRSTMEVITEEKVTRRSHTYGRPSHWPSEGDLYRYHSYPTTGVRSSSYRDLSRAHWTGGLDNCDIPFTQNIPLTLQPGYVIILDLTVWRLSRSFEIQLSAGHHSVYALFAVSVTFRGKITRVNFRSCVNKNISEEAYIEGHLPLYRDQRLVLSVVAQKRCFKVFVNEDHLWDCDHKLPLKKLTQLCVAGDIILHSSKVEKSTKLVKKHPFCTIL